jgi:HEAT repeat protein
MPDEQPTEDRARPGDERETRDVFICHSSADKEEYVRPLAAALDGIVDYWLDEAEIRWGDSIAQRVTEGLSSSRFVLVCLSRDFVGRTWPEKEMNTALSMESEDGVVRVLPLILSDKEHVRGSYPLLHDKKYIVWTNAREVADQIVGRARDLADHTAHGDTSLGTAPGGEPGEQFDSAMVMLKSEDDDERVRGVIVLGELGDARAVQPLIERLGDTNERVSTGAAWALGRLGDAGALDPLIERLKDESESKHVRGGAAQALGQMCDARAVQPLIERLNDDNESEDVRAKTAWALGRLGDARAVQPLIERLKNENESEHVRANAAWSLGELGDERAVQPLIERLENESADVRVSAAWALGRLGDARAVYPLIDRLRNEREDLRRWATAALYDMGAQAELALPTLREIAHGDESRLVREDAADTIREIEAAIGVEGEGENE